MRNGALSTDRIEAFHRDACVLVDLAEAAAWVDSLRGALGPIIEAGNRPGPWQFWELHNPWSRAAARIDGWSVLDICQSGALLDVVAALLGDDLVLFDSQLVPNPALPPEDTGAWRNDAVFFPGTANAGMVVRLPLHLEGSRAFECAVDPGGAAARALRLDLRPGQLLLHRPTLEYRCGPPGHALDGDFVIRYFAATACYQRDPGSPDQRELMERFPWINYAKMPLWLVRGEDHAGNDFVTGFHSASGRWTAASSAGLPDDQDAVQGE